ncbi:MAG: hypothetical protein LBI74_02310 [Synergistaceae bacterium]|jgi:hypothetical protein|nr:hypothetical protein [Synergistaceae bacterium]
MSYVRQTINSEKLSGIIDLPASLAHQVVEVLILPLETNHFDEPRKSVFGCLAKYANPDLVEKERDAWQNAARDEHGCSR